MSVSDASGEKRIFLRKASGLIRTASGTDTFIYNLGVVSVGLGVGTILYYGPAFYPMGDLIWGCVIAGIGMAMISLGFISWTVTLPRSGGIYVFASRISAPISGTHFEPRRNNGVALLLRNRRLLDSNAGVIANVRCARIADGHADLHEISKWILTPWVTFAIGSAILVLSGVILSYGMRFFLAVNKWVFILAMASTLFLIVTLAMRSESSL